MEKYIEHVNKRAQQEQEMRYNQAFARNFSFASEYFEQNAGQESEYEQDFRCYLIAFGNFSRVYNLFKTLKNALTQDAIYNKDYWHLTDGYLSEKDENFVLFMQQVNHAVHTFGKAIIDNYSEGEITDFEQFALSGRNIIKNILEKAEKQDEINSRQFAEITLLKHLDRTLRETLLSVNLIDALTSKFNT